MRPFEKILILIAILAGIAYSISRLFDSDLIFLFFFLTNGCCLALLIHYFFRIKLSVISGVTALLIIQIIGHTFSLYHLNGAELLETAGLIGSVIFALVIALSKFGGTPKIQFSIML